MGKQLPDLWDGCYDGEHRKLLAPEQFKQMFCDVCLNPGCGNSRGAGSKWSQRMLTQEDRLLHNPQFAPEDTAVIMGLPDFKDMVREALSLEISDRKGDWEPVSDAEVGRAAAEMMGVATPPAAFQAEDPEVLHPVDDLEPDPTVSGDPTVDTTVTPQTEGLSPRRESEEILPEHKESYAPPKDAAEHQEGESPPPSSIEGKWKVRGDSKGKDGKHSIYEVVLYADGRWECGCASRENPCKHARDLALRIANAPRDVVDPVEDPLPRGTPPAQAAPLRMNTSTPQGGIMVGGGVPDPVAEEADPWAPAEPKDRVIEVGGRVSFGSGKNQKK